MTATRITITGQFSEAEIKRFVEVLQGIEREHPEDRTYMLTFDTDLSLDESQTVLERVMGDVRPGYKREMVTVHKGGNG